VVADEAVAGGGATSGPPLYSAVSIPRLPNSPQQRALTRGREDLVGARTALVNQLRAEPERFWPGPLGLLAICMR
jgi:hypothetical protein